MGLDASGHDSRRGVGVRADAAGQAGRDTGISRVLAGFLLAAGLTALGGCAARTPQPVPPLGNRALPETLLDASGAPLPQPVFLAGVARADYILVGEEHPNPCDHLAQAGLIRRLLASGLRPAIAMEMVPADLQPVLDAFNAGKLGVADLPQALAWKTSWGFDFELYAPIFEVAREFRLPVFAANAPAGLARTVGRQGLDALSPTQRASLPGAILPPAPAQVEELKELFSQHSAMRAKSANAPDGHDPLARFVTVQSLWDTQMAARAMLARALYDRPVVIVAGAGHVERGWGIARRLARLDPKATVATIMPWRGGEAPDAALAPVFFACPQVQRSRLGMTLSHEAPAPGQPAPPLLVTAVAPDSPAARAGLLAGDAVLNAGSHEATSLMVLHKAAAEALKAEKPLTLTVSRGGETLSVAIPLPAPTPGKK